MHRVLVASDAPAIEAFVRSGLPKILAYASGYYRKRPHSSSEGVKTLLHQFSVPVAVADELRPAFYSSSVAAVNRLPGRSRWFLAQCHLRLLWRAVRLATVALQASQNAVRPA